MLENLFLFFLRTNENQTLNHSNNKIKLGSTRNRCFVEGIIVVCVCVFRNNLIVTLWN